MSSYELPDDLWLFIMSCLDYKDLVSCSLVNRQFNCLSNHNSLWKPLCKRHWLENNCPSHVSWKEHFAVMYFDFGRYIHCYSKIKTAWDQILCFMDEHFPNTSNNLLPGTTEDQLDSVEKEINHPLPLDLRCSYRLKNGQKNIFDDGPLGGVCLSSYIRLDSLLAIQIACKFLQMGDDLPRCMPLTMNRTTGFCQLVSLSDECGQTFGQIFTHDERDQESLEAVSPRYVFILGKDFTSWFTDYASSLAKNHYSIINDQIFRFYREPDCLKRTNSIQVSVATCFIPEFSRAGHQYCHGYQITMWMDEDAPPSESCQLETRHWIITDENGVEERVDGPGVVGEFPIMRPGAKFTWISCCSLKTTYGNMQGYFTMRNLRTGNATDVFCPVFHMKCPPYMQIRNINSNKSAIEELE